MPMFVGIVSSMESSASTPSFPHLLFLLLVQDAEVCRPAKKLIESDVLVELLHGHAQLFGNAEAEHH